VTDGANKTPAVFLDRDGTLIRDVGYLHRREQVEILPRVPQAMRLLRRRGFLLVVVTNQSAVARGRLTEEELDRIHDDLKARLAQEGARLDGIYYCPHHPTEGSGQYKVACDCRKPNPGLVRRAAADLGLDLSFSYMVGDQQIDMELADRVGAKGILIAGRPNVGEESADHRHAVVADLWQAAQWIVGDYQRSPGR